MVIANSWSCNWDSEELSQVLKVPASTNTIAEMPNDEDNDEDKCITILQEWIQVKAGDRETLAELFQEKGYYSMSSFVSEL